MLRSLVGSEMCIRDRWYAARAKDIFTKHFFSCLEIGTRHGIPAVSFKVRNMRTRWGSCTTCLLYTSDAADDLLCVDLGGRRIIKKKKTTKKKKKKYNKKKKTQHHEKHRHT